MSSWLLLKTALGVKTTGVLFTGGDTEAQRRSLSTVAQPAVKPYSNSLLSTPLSQYQLVEGACDTDAPCPPGTEEQGGPKLTVPSWEAVSNHHHVIP